MYSHRLSNSRGVAILFKRAYNPNIIDSEIDPEGRFLLVKLQHQSETVALINVYAPTQSEIRKQLSFMDTLDALVSDIDAHNIFLGGDLKAHMDEDSAESNSQELPHSVNKQTYINRIKSLNTFLNLTDVWRQRYPNSQKGTFHRGPYSARLDYWFISNHMLPTIAALDISPHPLSDHSMLTLRVGIEELDRGPGYWRFNNTLLEDATFIQDMTAHITSTIQNNSIENPNVAWEWE